MFVDRERRRYIGLLVVRERRVCITVLAVSDREEGVLVC